jgi:GDPmannose 4,6-dehydratase
VLNHTLQLERYEFKETDILKTALITGVTGQDGHHLTKLLLSKDYQVYGLINGQRNSAEVRFKSLFPKVNLIQGDLADFTSLLNALLISKPSEIYNLGAISFVGMSFEQPELTTDITGLGCLRLLEAIRKSNLNDIKFYQASSSEMFGKVQAIPQNEDTRFYPRSPYGVAKTFAHHMCVNYREAYGMHVSSGILFNHEGEYRGHEFVTRKITSNVAKIKLGKIKRFSLGLLSPKRDWGYAGDYVEAMWKMVQQTIPDDFVISTGVAHSVKDFVLKSLEVAGLGDDLEKYIDFDKNVTRPSEVDLLIGDSSKAKKVLNWSPTVNFEKLVEIMVENDLKIEKNNL